MRTPLAVLVVLVLGACGGSSDSGSDSRSGATASATSSATSAPSASASPSNPLAGTWELTVESPRRTFGTNHFASATVTLASSRITVSGTSGAKSSAPVEDGQITIKCRTICAAGLLGFQPQGSGYRLVNAATLEPEPVQSGASYCGAPAAPQARVITDLTPTSFSYIDGYAGNVGGGSCFQVLWTVKATKVS